jgi:hypothetical protein
MDHAGFGEAFEREFLRHPFGSLPKAETELLIFALLMQHGPLTASMSDFEIANRLLLTPGRARSLRYRYDLRRAAELTPSQLQSEVLEAIMPVRFEAEGEMVHLRIERGYLRDTLVERLRAAGVGADGSFSTAVIRVQLYRLIAVLADLASDGDAYADLMARLGATRKPEDDADVWLGRIRDVLDQAVSRTAASGIVALVTQIVKAG